MQKCDVHITNTEDQFLTADIQVLVYLSAAEQRKDSILEMAMLMLVKLFFAFSASYFASVWATRQAYADRGYEAYGGEYILAIIVFLISYGIITVFFRRFRRKKV